MRASDADRDRIADQLREALAEGRLTPEEHSERLDAVYRAKTYAELAPIVHDLPATGGVREGTAPPVRGDLPAPYAGSPNIFAVFSGAERGGRWLVEPQTSVVAVFGGVELDLREAVLSQRDVTINVVAVFGGVNVVVPPGVRVHNSMTAIFGGCSVPREEDVGPDAPVVRLTGFALFGGVSVERRVADDRTGRSRGLGGRDRRAAMHGEAWHGLPGGRRERREVRRRARDRRRRRGY
jgi:hypothetical protein